MCWSNKLAADEAIAPADTLLLTVPNQLGVEYNAHDIEGILTPVARSSGGADPPPWRAHAPCGQVTPTSLRRCNRLAARVRSDGLLPKPDGALEPSFRARTDTRTEAMAQAGESMELDVRASLA
jgi:hypothetical protein